MLPGYLVDVRIAEALTSYNVPLESPDSFLYACYVVAQMEQRGLPGQGGTSGRLGLKASEVGLIPVSGRYR